MGTREARLTSFLLGAGTGTDFVAVFRRDGLTSSWGTDQEEVKAGQKISKASDFLREIHVPKPIQYHPRSESPTAPAPDPPRGGQGHVPVPSI